MPHIVTVKFHRAGRHYDFNAQDFDLKPGSRVVVETDRGRALAFVVTAPREVAEDQAPEGLKSVLRPASEDDLAQAHANSAREKEALRYCRDRIQGRQMDMKLVRAEYAFDGSKIVFYFTAEGRIDFRELVKDLAHHFHTRIEMRQIGVRDEAKLVGGMGICGRELCCCSFLTEFYPVSVKMAKEQGLALNPTKISGQCGRLLCCLGYEFESYCEMRKGMPKCGKKITWDNREWEVTAQNILGRQFTLRAGDGSVRIVTTEEYESGQPRDHAPFSPPAPPQRRQGGGQAQRSRPAAPERPSAPPRPEPVPEPAPPDAVTDGEAQTQTDPASSRRRRRRRRPRDSRPAPAEPQGE
jgi:cell fate regulator YaaT (PSP1 superfamily)